MVSIRLVGLAVLSVTGVLATTSPLESDRPDECPPCFNCMLPAFSCKQFATCNEFNGRCECPDGFGGDDCSEPVCGGLSDGRNRPIRQGDECQCKEGWGGINCNMCEENDACDAFMPGGEAGTCYKGGILVNKNHQMCDVTNRKIVDILKGKKPQVTFSCNRTEAECNFQFWVDQRESFFCGLHDCEFETDFLSDKNVTRYSCPKIDCACVPGRMLCGEKGSIDISDFLTETIRGPGYFECDSKDDNCKFSEPSMNDLIKNVFGDSYITLTCDASECLHYTELPGYHEPVKRVNRAFVLSTSAIALAILILGGLGVNYLIQVSQEKKVNRIALPSDDDRAKLMMSHKPTSLQFDNVSYVDNDRQILSNAFGTVESGQVMAILGGSGAGKTTLLDILARKKKKGQAAGDIYVNGKQYSSKQYKRVIGFVDQEDYLMPTLTVYETIATSALLRLPKTMSDDAKRLRALETMNELGILDIKDQIIGDESNRGISGGEKRRVAIACELVTSPSILFLDEPTSGLDAYNAHNVIESLVNLARNFDRTVVVTIHQPRSNIFSLFDKVILLAQGKVVYSGAQIRAAEHFSELGYTCPPSYNLADYLIDLTMKNSDSSSGESTEGTSSSLLERNQEDDEDLHNPLARAGTDIDVTREWRHYASHRDEDRQLLRQRNTGDGSNGARAGGSGSGSRTTGTTAKVEELVEMFNGSTAYAEVKDDIQRATGNAAAAATSSSDEDDEGQELRGYETVGLVRQFTILSIRTFKNLYRNPMLLLTHYVIAIILGMFCGVLYFNISNDISGFQNRLGLFFFLLALFGFSTLTTLNLFAQERIVFVRERANGYYRPIAYYCAKVLFDIIPLRVFPPIILGMIIYPLAGLSTDNNAFWKFLLILTLFNLTAASICLVIGIVIQDSGVANLVGSLVMLFSLLFAGLFLNPDSMPPGTKWFEYASIFHYAYEALAVNEVRYLTLTERKFGLSIEVPGATILSTFGFDVGALWADVWGLVIFFLVFITWGYVAMHYMLIERR